MALYHNLVGLALARPDMREALAPMLKKAGLSSMDVAIFDFVSNHFLGELTEAFVESCNYQASIQKAEPGYVEGKISTVQWRLKFEIAHKGDGYDLEALLHVGASFQNAQFHRWEVGQHESLEDLFSKLNATLTGYAR